MKRSYLAWWLFAASICTYTNSAYATLIDRGGGLIYDDFLNITWLADAHFGAGSIYDDGPNNSTNPTTDGNMTWQNAVDWAASLTYYDSIRNVTYSDWRLPLVPAPGSCTPTSCGSGNELGHLFFDLGGVANTDISFTHNSNYDLFSNLTGSFWSGTDDSSITAYAFDFVIPGEVSALKTQARGAWAVRPGDVAAVPTPSAMWLFASGLLYLAGMIKGDIGIKFQRSKFISSVPFLFWRSSTGSSARQMAKKT